MGKCGKFLFIVASLIAVFVGVKIKECSKSPPIPTVPEPYWGPGKEVKDDTTIKPFKVNISDNVLDDLKNRLLRHRLITKSLEDSNHHYGINSALLSEVVDFWRNDYDWRKREVYLNKFPQFKTQIQGLDIHYIHVKPDTNIQKIPLLILHGWPGSVREFYEIIPMLTEVQKGRNFVFEIVAPSLPGYGFSDGASKSGLGAVEMSAVLKNLMIRLGYKRFYVQGGDWGSTLAATMGTIYPDYVKGIHCNMCMNYNPVSYLKLFVASFYPTYFMTEKEVESIYPLSNLMSKHVLESGYFHLQATKPDTLGVGLNDSPVGLAAYILEKFIIGTNYSYRNRMDGGLKIKFDYNKLLDNVMIYWVTNSITTSMRLYSETVNVAQRKYNINKIETKVPSACAQFINDLFYQPEWILRDKYVNMVHLKNFDDGGHFAALEVPGVLSQDIFEAITKMEVLETTKE
ncbi:PREDICTED: juvenile hormone epoxide hydrolase 1-like [Nicrophorus vespilloides]|uniref:Epoxide hydrolase n=1 Tax=Nicrophorus vespilloides TaxID=110193 RepID=A0ABM1M2S7_NICVS|nr:PREDICTED: juvenile hormone epoxide hydrolase 1-like [Nicrophorus vespilloides]